MIPDVIATSGTVATTTASRLLLSPTVANASRGLNFFAAQLIFQRGWRQTLWMCQEAVTLFNAESCFKVSKFFFSAEKDTLYLLLIL